MEYIVIVEQRRVKRIVNGLLQSAFAFAIARAHDSHTTIFEHHLHVVEVEIHKAMIGYYLGNALGCNAQRIVGTSKSLD